MIPQRLQPPAAGENENTAMHFTDVEPRARRFFDGIQQDHPREYASLDRFRDSPLVMMAVKQGGRDPWTRP